MKLSKTYNLRVDNPGLADQWHPVKNGNLMPEDVTPGSGKKVWWLSEKGHEWREKVYLHDRSEGCPLCQKEKPDQKKSRNRLVSKAYRGPYKPIISRGKHGSSNSFQVNTMLEEKAITRQKGRYK